MESEAETRIYKPQTHARAGRVIKGPIAGHFCKPDECPNYTNQPSFNIKLANGMMVTSEKDFIDVPEEEFEQEKEE